MQKKNITVIGGGASGVMAALAAAEDGASVTLLERNSRIGKKLLATGNGRCNYTNENLTADDYNHPDFVKHGLAQFSSTDTLVFFKNLGIDPKYEEEGKVFPRSEQASSFLDIFLYELDRRGVNIVTDAYVQNIVAKKNGFLIFLADGTSYKADKVIISTGGKAMPKSGSEGSGYVIAQSLGHTITDVFPALTKLKIDSPYLKQLDGVKFPGAVELFADNVSLQKEKDDILFTKYGISGPAIMQLSRKANEALAKKQKTEIKVSIIDTLSKRDIAKRMDSSMDKPVDYSLIGLVNKRLIAALLKEAGVEKQNALVSSLRDDTRNKIIDLLFDWRFPVKGSMGFDDAQVTAGGVSCEEIDPNTMESKLVKGLYFTGEIMDIDGKCGGYNLQWAWTSGYLAGENAAKDMEYDD
ncbi:MAG TPA: NAD(P)/FAD-dependent oxidoreductase [Bacillota bacterium]|nr:NAD(P)/FAD-dependent oxidoreductase [Bacillota bacterium]HPF42636.1 NAD(P)/FAD-dependent oxidoreductase [Bacillota bacterium]HPJ86199.1 NAD(P)/FAD-dependent oxidoreductase [Bacillota bacterium]HPQ62267.1 NAD(P)/FAD-dependent oxidoreductase [Bacillota bacterium]HRX91888.1 NAD(P)/FAD-dependent oxidoreductase [Candidatus Izemoplasmatales bacterium]